MKKTLALMMCVLPLMLVAQVFGPPDAVPKEIWKEYDRSQRKEVRQEKREAREPQKGYDYVIPEYPFPVVQANPKNWVLDQLEIRENWGRIKSMVKGKVDCAILDTGFPDNKNTAKFASPKAPVSYTGEPPLDGHFHSTHVAGSQSAKNVGVANVVAEMGLFTQTYYKVCTNQGGCSNTWMRDAVSDYRVYYNNNLKPKNISAAINMSIGGGNLSPSLDAEMKKASEDGIPIFASAGNNGAVKISCPACSDYTFSVGATNRDGSKASFSNQGPDQSFSAGGVAVTSTCLGDTYCNASGTSMSSPQVAAVYLILKSIKPKWEPSKVIAFMAEHAYDAGEPGFDDVYGYGIPKMGAYLDALEDGGEPDPPNCDDGIRNGQETGVDCGGPECPPCDTPPPSDCGRRPEATLTMKLEGEWWMPWGYVNTASAQRPFDYAPDVPGASTLANASKRTRITEMHIELTTDQKAPCSFDKLKPSVDGFFVNRALGMPGSMDFTEVLKYTGFFMDMSLERKGVDIRMVYMEGDNGEGTIPTVLHEEDLLDWVRTASEDYTYLWRGRVLWKINATTSPPGLPTIPYVDFVVTRETVPVKGEREPPELEDLIPPVKGWVPVIIL